MTTENNTPPTIEPRENGPLIVKNLDDFVLSDGTKAEAKPLLALCRCGRSANKPFCDGSHKDAGFDGASSEVVKSDRSYTYKGDDVTVHFNKLLCSHAGECGKRASEIFNTKAKPWVQPDNGSLGQILDVVAACPSGALRYAHGDGAPQAITSTEVSITVEPNGPYQVRNIDVPAGYWAKGQSPKKYVLCRCGLSKKSHFATAPTMTKAGKTPTKAHSSRRLLPL